MGMDKFQSYIEQGEQESKQNQEVWAYSRGAAEIRNSGGRLSLQSKCSTNLAFMERGSFPFSHKPRKGTWQTGWKIMLSNKVKANPFV